MNKKAMETIPALVILTLVLLVAGGALIFIFQKNAFGFNKSTENLMSCSGFPGAPAGAVGECVRDPSKCPSGNVFKLGCVDNENGDFCCFGKADIGSGKVDPEKVPEELKECYTQDGTCDSVCKVGITEFKFQGRDGSDSETFLGENHPIYLTVTLDKLYDYAAYNCITEKAISFGPVKDGVMKPSDQFSCVRTHIEDNWANFECKIYRKSANGYGLFYVFTGPREFQFEFRLDSSKSPECKCINGMNAEAKYTFKGTFDD